MLCCGVLCCLVVSCVVVSCVVVPFVVVSCVVRGVLCEVCCGCVGGVVKYKFIKTTFIKKSSFIKIHFDGFTETRLVPAFRVSTGLHVERGLGVQGLGVQGSGVRVYDILGGQKCDQGSGPKIAKILGGVQFLHFGPPLRSKKVLLTTEKVESAQN